MFKKWGNLKVKVEVDGIQIAKFEGDLKQCEEKWNNNVRKKMR